MSWAAVLLAAALMVGGGPARIRGRVGTQAVSTPRRADPLAAATCFDVLAACDVAAAARLLPIARSIGRASRGQARVR